MSFPQVSSWQGGAGRTIPAGLLWLLPAVATARLWVAPTQLPAWTAVEPLVLAGAFVGVCLWLLVLANAVGRAHGRLGPDDLAAVGQRESLAAGSVDLPTPPRVGPGYPPAWVALGTVLAATCLLHFSGAGAQIPDLHVAPWLGQTWLPLAVTGVIWMAAGAAVYNQHRARRLTLELQAAQRGTRLALDTIEHLPVMVSTCALDGSRRLLNDRYREVVAVSEDQFVGRNWLDRLTEDDRGAFDTLFGERSALRQSGPALSGSLVRQFEYAVVGGDGQRRWVRECFVPRYDRRQQLIGFLATGYEISAQIESEAKLAVAAEVWKEKLETLRAELDAQAQQTRDAKAQTAEVLGQAASLRDRMRWLEEDHRRLPTSATPAASDATAPPASDRTQTPAPNTRPRRRAIAGCVPQQQLDSDLGRVSALGLKRLQLESLNPLGGIVPLVLLPAEQEPLELCGQVESCGELDGGRYDVVLSLIEVDGKTQKQIKRIARSHRAAG